MFDFEHFQFYCFPISRTGVECWAAVISVGIDEEQIISRSWNAWKKETTITKRLFSFVLSIRDQRATAFLYILICFGPSLVTVDRLNKQTTWQRPKRMRKFLFGTGSVLLIFLFSSVRFDLLFYKSIRFDSIRFTFQKVQFDSTTLE